MCHEKMALDMSAYDYIYVPAQSRTHIRHEWPGPVGTLIQVGLAWAVHDGYDIIN